jgi:hypothetical protein
MIQDMFDPIYYYAVNQIKLKNSDESQYVTFKYKEILDTVGTLVLFKNILFLILNMAQNNRKILRYATDH